MFRKREWKHMNVDSSSFNTNTGSSFFWTHKPSINVVSLHANIRIIIPCHIKDLALNPKTGHIKHKRPTRVLTQNLIASISCCCHVLQISPSHPQNLHRKTSHIKHRDTTRFLAQRLTTPSFVLPSIHAGADKSTPRPPEIISAVFGLVIIA